MKFNLFTTLFAALIAFAYAQYPDAGVAITNPTLDQTVAIGSNFTIMWSVIDANASDITRVSLMFGNASTLIYYVYNFLNDNETIPVNTGAYNWTIPSNITAATDYVITLSNNQSSTTYSSYFTLQ